jgi:hypothetical protein
MKYMADNMKRLVRVPSFMKDRLTKLSAELDDVKKAIDSTVKDNVDFEMHVRKCIEHGKAEPLPCYKEVYGHIKYTL